MNSFNPGDTVQLRANYLNVAYLTKRIGHGYLHLTPGMKGKVVRYTAAADKVGVEFEEQIWSVKYDGQKSGHDNGCHGHGTIGHCIYLPIGCVGDPSILTAKKDTDDLLITC